MPNWRNLLHLEKSASFVRPEEAIVDPQIIRDKVDEEDGELEDRYNDDFLKVFTPASWRPTEGKSKEENVASFRSYVTEMEDKMKRHLKFLEIELSKVESKKEKGETSKKRKREVERDGCGEWPVIVIDSDNDDAEGNWREGAGVEEEGKEKDECDEADEDEENEEDEENQEDDETDENSQSDVNSDSETNSVKEAVVDSDEASESRSCSYDDDDSGSDCDSGNQQEGNQETSEDSSMFRMKISD